VAAFASTSQKTTVPPWREDAGCEPIIVLALPLEISGGCENSRGLTMMQRITRRTRLARAATVACLAIGGVLGVTVTAAANVGNPGSFTFTVTGGSLQVGQVAVGLPAGSMAGTIDASGAFSLPQSSLVVTDQPFSDNVLGESVDGTVSADTTSLSGTLDPATGTATLNSSLFMTASFSVSGILVNYSGTCTVGGIAPADHLPVTLTTGSPGVPYSDQTGAVTLVANLGNAVSCDPAIPVLLQSFIDGPEVLTLSGTTTPVLVPDAHLAVSPSPLAFGDLPLGTAKTLTVTFTNSGTDSTDISGIGLGGTDAADFTIVSGSLNCPGAVNNIAQVPPGSPCTVDVSFSPGATGDRTADLVVGNDSLDGTQTVPLTGTGSNSAVSLGATNLDFGQQVVGTSSAPTPVTVTNSGTTSLIISGVSVGGDFAAGASSCTAQPVPAGQACVINVTFSPTTTGPRTGMVTIKSNAASSPDSVTLTGTGVAPVLSAGPGSLAFGTVPIGTTSSSQTVTVSNTGTSGLHVSGATANAPFVISSDGCSGAGAIAPGGTCQIAVQYAPASTGPASGALTISSDGGTATVTLAGTGSPSADLNVSMGASPNPVHRNKTLTYTITVVNAGPAAASTVLAVDQLPANVQFQSLSAPSGASCVGPAVGATGTVKCTLGSLASGASVQLRIVTLVVAPKVVTISNTAQVSSAVFDPDLRDNAVTVSTAVQ
jgi:uncharacterized repeat protein (TIGR01451 family)